MIVLLADLGGANRGAVSTVAAAKGAITAGATVQAVGVVPDDGDGDRRLLELAAAGVGHAAVLRGPARDLEADDVDLALRYLPDIRVIVALGMPAPIVAKASEQATWSGAALVVVTGAAAGGDGRTAAAGAGGVPAEPADQAIVLQAPPSDPDGTFAGFVGAFAAALDKGAAPADAWSATTRALAVDAV